MDQSDVVVLVKRNIEDAIPEKSRINLKITAIDLCDIYIVLGSNSGTLFFFSCENSSLLQRIPMKNGRVVQISINPDRAYLGFASSSGLVHVIQVPGQVPRLSLHPVSSRRHEGTTVTSLAWSQTGRDLYIGDNVGMLSLLHVPPNLASSLILNLTHCLMKLDSGIFQLDVKHHYVLISTLTKSYICNTRLEIISLIGTKSRQGEYGGCICPVKIHDVKTCVCKESLEPNQQLKVPHDGKFQNSSEFSVCNGEVLCEQPRQEFTDEVKILKFNLPDKIQKFVKKEIYAKNDNVNAVYFNSDNYRIFCGRPGLRIWESDFKGFVMATHQFRNALLTQKTLIISLSHKDNSFDAFDTDGLYYNSQSFKKILNFHGGYMIVNSASAFYLIHPNTSKVIIWCPVHEGIKDIKTNGNSLLILTLDANVHKFQISTADIAILILHASGLLSQCAKLCLKYSSILATSKLLKHRWLFIINDIILNCKDKELVAGVSNLKNNFNTHLSTANAKVYALPNSKKNFNLEPCLSKRQNVNHSKPLTTVPKTDESVANSIEKVFGKGVFKNLYGSVAANIVNSNKSDICNEVSNLSSLQKTGRLLLNFGDFLVNGKESSTYKVLENQKYIYGNYRDNGTSILNDRRVCTRRTKISDTIPGMRGVYSDTKGKHPDISIITEKTNRENRCLPEYMKEFHRIVCNIKIILQLFSQSRSVTKALLILFLKEYKETNDKIVVNVVNNSEIDSLLVNNETVTEFSDLVKEVTHLLLFCLQERIILSHKCIPDAGDCVPEHSLTPKLTTDLDIFYSFLLSGDRGLIDCSIMINGFHVVERHLMFRTWFLVMEKVSTDAKDVHNFQILPDVASRAHRIQFFRFILETNGWDSFMAAVSKIPNPTILFDIYYFFIYFYQKYGKINLHDSLKTYLNNISHTLIGDYYAKYWSKSPEMQTDIIISLLNDYNEEEYVCSCKYPLPNSLSHKSLSMSLVQLMISLPVYYPSKLFTIFQRKYFYSGIFTIAFRYKVTQYDQLVPYILQSFDKPSIICILDHLTPSQYPQLLGTLSKMAGANDSKVSCLNCSMQLSVCFNKLNRSPTNLTKLKPKLDSQDCSLELKNYSELWQLIFIKMNERFGNLRSLQLLQEIGNDLPRSDFLKRLFLQSIISTFADKSKIGLDLARLAVIPKVYFSPEIRCQLDSILISEVEEDKGVYHSRDKNLNKVYIDSNILNLNPEDISSGCIDTLRNQITCVASPPMLQPPNGFSFTVKSNRFSHHWGVKAQILNGVCQLCQLALTVDVMVNAGGLKVFACAHAYHTICLTQYGKVCVVCNRVK